MRKGPDLLFKANTTKLGSELFFFELLFFHRGTLLVASRPRGVHFFLVILGHPQKLEPLLLGACRASPL